MAAGLHQAIVVVTTSNFFGRYNFILLLKSLFKDDPPDLQDIRLTYRYAATITSGYLTLEAKKASDTHSCSVVADRQVHHGGLVGTILSACMHWGSTALAGSFRSCSEGREHLYVTQLLLKLTTELIHQQLLLTLACRTLTRSIIIASEADLRKVELPAQRLTRFTGRRVELPFIFLCLPS